VSGPAVKCATASPTVCKDPITLISLAVAQELGMAAVDRSQRGVEMVRVERMHDLPGNRVAVCRGQVYGA
jgi:hypothetical protein